MISGCDFFSISIKFSNLFDLFFAFQYIIYCLTSNKSVRILLSIINLIGGGEDSDNLSISASVFCTDTFRFIIGVLHIVDVVEETFAGTSQKTPLILPLTKFLIRQRSGVLTHCHINIQIKRLNFSVEKIVH